MPVTIDHPDFLAPPGETIIWRYMSFTKLLSLLTTRSLFLASLDELRKEDPFEGIPPNINRQLSRELLSDLPQARRSLRLPEDISENLITIIAKSIGNPSG